MTQSREQHLAILNDRAREIAVRLLPQIQSMVLDQMTTLGSPTGEAEMMRACERVGEAVDRLTQSKYTPDEIPARKALERAAQNLRRTMARHGRMP